MKRSARHDMSKMPLRFKLTLAFTGVMAVLLTGAGIALSVLVAHNLDSTIDDGLAARAGDAAAVVRNGRLGATGEPFAQVLSDAGRVLDTTTGAGATPLLSTPDRARALRGPVIVNLRRQGADLRLLAPPVTARGRRALLVVGESLGQRERALDALHALLAVGGPLALLIASAVGYALAAAAPPPVGGVRRPAAAGHRAAAAGAAPGGAQAPPRRRGDRGGHQRPDAGSARQRRDPAPEHDA